MDLQQESSKLKELPTTTSRNLSSSSSAFVSASQSPFFSPRSPKIHLTESVRSDIQNPASILSSKGESESLHGISYTAGDVLRNVEKASSDFKIPDWVTSYNGVCSGSSSNCSQGANKANLGQREKQKRWGRTQGKSSFTRGPISYTSSTHPRSCDVYIGFHGRKPSLLRFANWLRAELEVQGVSCFVVDKARCRNARSQVVVEKAMNASTFGVVILTKKSFGNPYSIEELRNFLDKKNLVPIFFDLASGDCLARDIIERRGELWEKHGGELWIPYGGLEKEWKHAVEGLSRVDEWKLEASDGNWRDCILNAVTIIATRLGRRSVVDRVNHWRERVEKEEFPFPRNDDFVGRKKELSELELMLFGDISGDGERDYFELKTRSRRKNVVIRHSERNQLVEEESLKDGQSEGSGKGKEPVIWKESEREIEMQRVGSPQRQCRPRRATNGGRYGRRKRSTKIFYGMGIACVTGESGIGKTELLLEYAYRYYQRYKMVLWVGGESRYIRQNYLNLRSFLEVDVSIENHSLERGRAKCFEEQEEDAVTRVRRELMRDIPYLVIIDNLESEKDWWDHKLIMDLLPRFSGETHFIISTRLTRVMNLEPMRLSYLSGIEALSLMKGRFKDYSIAEIEALKAMEERLGRLTLGLGVVGAILSELPIGPNRLLDTINRMPLRDLAWGGREALTLRKHTFLMQLLDVCFSIFDHAEGPMSLATRMVQASGWFAPSAIPVSLLALAAHKIHEKRHNRSKLWKKCVNALTCSFTTSHMKRTESEAASMLVRFGIAKSSEKPGCIHFHEMVKLYARKRGASKVARAMVQAVGIRGSVAHHSEHLWAACFTVFGFGTDPVIVELNVTELLLFVRRVTLPLAVHAFITFSRCSAALELLRLCSEALEAMGESLVAHVEKWLDRSICCMRPARSDAQLNPYLWQELSLLRATVLEMRAKLMLRGGQYDAADDLVRKAIFIRTSICGEDHPDTVAAHEMLSRLTRLLTNVQSS
ncbi:hypothetical protein QJS04_geneDACA000373 [Acorus gramineus]|uniref:TIR domain-containing protein n=1 Tax=Acorus gramineus TaxID=55184 RepID=A0AAV9APX8_ACOGR|nr:hypothetical protein QJS04_geneDACA000373 [Acorus gramineus]